MSISQVLGSAQQYLQVSIGDIDKLMLEASADSMTKQQMDAQLTSREAQLRALVEQLRRRDEQLRVRDRQLEVLRHENRSLEDEIRLTTSLMSALDERSSRPRSPDSDEHQPPRAPSGVSDNSVANTTATPAPRYIISLCFLFLVFCLWWLRRVCNRLDDSATPLEILKTQLKQAAMKRHADSRSVPVYTLFLQCACNSLLFSFLSLRRQSIRLRCMTNSSQTPRLRGMCVSLVSPQFVLFCFVR